MLHTTLNPKFKLSQDTIFIPEIEIPTKIENFNMQVSSTPIEKLRTIRSFVLRKGRSSLAQAKQQQLWQRYGITYSTGQTLDLRQYFESCQPLVLDIGFGNGKALLQVAADHPNYNFIGVEVYASGINQALQQLANSQLKNVKIISADAKEVLTSAIAGSFTIIQLLFPDPWPKARHHKRRLVQPDFIKLVADKLTQTGIFYFVTDWVDYAEHVTEVMTIAKQFSKIPGSQLNASILPRKAHTKFEQRGLNLGHSIYELGFQKF